MEQKGSFIGFTFGNRHSSKLGIFRTSQSNRYTIDLTPQTFDTVTDLKTADGSYFWSSKYTKREIPISFAFYGLTEEQIQQLKRVFNDKKIHPLILDEEPYKVWSAKLTGTAICKHICFEQNGQRFYCGEGTFQFVAFYPFARSRYQYIEDYTIENIREWIDRNSLLVSEFEEGIIYPAILSYAFDENENAGSIAMIEAGFEEWLEETELLIESDLNMINVNSCIEFFVDNGPYHNFDEWRAASQIPSNTRYGNYLVGQYLLYNAGDVDMPFKLYLPISGLTFPLNIKCGDKKIQIKRFAPCVGDVYLLYDGFTHTLRGCDENYKITKNLYNKHIISGDFFELPTGEVALKCPEGLLEYNYLYL